MNGSKKAILIIVSVLVVFAIPILFFSEQRQESIEAFISEAQFAENRSIGALLIILLFSGDILLPVPSSAVCAIAGRIYGVIAGTVLCWLGLNISAGIGYWLGRSFGWAAVNRFSSTTDVEEVKSGIQRWGVWPIVLCRPIPVLAEATILMLGTYRYPAAKFWPPILIANLIFSFSFVSLGVWFAEQDNFLIGLAVSCLVPGLLLLGWSLCQGKKSSQEPTH